MSDLINRADAIEAIFKVGHEHVEEKVIPLGAVTDYSDAIKALPSAEATGALDDAIAKYVADGLMELPSAEAEWIPCSERLPKMREVTHYGETYRMSECVLVTGTLEYQDFDTYNTSILVGNCFDDMNGTDIYWYQNEDRIINVTAWMPLPKPYEGGDDTTGESL